MLAQFVPSYGQIKLVEDLVEQMMTGHFDQFGQKVPFAHGKQMSAFGEKDGLLRGDGNLGRDIVIVGVAQGLQLLTQMFCEVSSIYTFHYWADKSHCLLLEVTAIPRPLELFAEHCQSWTHLRLVRK